jgi:hypothetical protein
MKNITDINEYKDKIRLTTKGGAKHLRIVVTKNERTCSIKFFSTGKETLLPGVETSRQAYEKFDTEVRRVMDWQKEDK